MTETISRPVLFDPETERARQDQLAQQEFIGAVEAVRKGNVRELPDLTGAIDHTGYVSRGVEAVLQGDTDRVFLSSGFYDFIGSDDLPDRVTFAPQPLLRLGKERSRQQVFFGSLDNRWFNNQNDFAGDIAVKPIPDNPLKRWELMHEAAMYQYVAKLGLPTLKVLGIVLFDEPKSKLAGFVMTERDPDVTTLDTLPWDKMTQTETWDYVDKALDTHAALNSELIFHGDAGFQNIAIGEAQNSFKVVDLNSSGSLLAATDRVDRIQNFMGTDLAFTALSIGEFIFNNMPSDDRPQNDSERFDLLYNRVYQPYYERLVHTDRGHLDVLSKAYDETLRQRFAEAAS